LTPQAKMRIFVKFFPDVDTLSLEISKSDTFRKFKEELYNLTNLQQGDDLQMIYQGMTIKTDIHQLQDYNVKV
jgi:hypothetical protein